MSERSWREKMARCFGTPPDVRGFHGECRTYKLVFDDEWHIVCGNCGAHELAPHEAPPSMTERQWHRWLGVAS